MQKSAPLFRSAALLCTLAAATSTFAQAKLERIPFDPASAPAIHRITLLDTPIVSRYSIWDTGGSSLALFGAGGGLVKSAQISALMEKVTAEYSRQGINYAQVLDKSLEERLKQAGYDVLRLPGVQPSGGTKESPLNFQDIKSDGDAILSVRLTTTGFATSSTLRTEFFPISFISVRLMSRDGTRPLLLHFASYCSHLVKSDAVSKIPCLPDVSPISTEEQLLSSVASNELLAGADVLAKDIVAQIRPAFHGTEKP
jgi:hypothetical protein